MRIPNRSIFIAFSLLLFFTPFNTQSFQSMNGSIDSSQVYSAYMKIKGDREYRESLLIDEENRVKREAAILVIESSRRARSSLDESGGVFIDLYKHILPEQFYNYVMRPIAYTSGGYKQVDNSVELINRSKQYLSSQYDYLENLEELEKDYLNVMFYTGLFENVGENKLDDSDEVITNVFSAYEVLVNITDEVSYLDEKQTLANQLVNYATNYSEKLGKSIKYGLENKIPLSLLSTTPTIDSQKSKNYMLPSDGNFLLEKIEGSSNNKVSQVRSLNSKFEKMLIRSHPIAQKKILSDKRKELLKIKSSSTYQNFAYTAAMAKAVQSLQNVGINLPENASKALNSIDLFSQASMLYMEGKVNPIKYFDAFTTFTSAIGVFSSKSSGSVDKAILKKLELIDSKLDTVLENQVLLSKQLDELKNQIYKMQTILIENQLIISDQVNLNTRLAKELKRNYINSSCYVSVWSDLLINKNFSGLNIPIKNESNLSQNLFNAYLSASHNKSMSSMESEIVLGVKQLNSTDAFNIVECAKEIKSFYGLKDGEFTSIYDIRGSKNLTEVDEKLLKSKEHLFLIVKNYFKENPEVFPNFLGSNISSSLSYADYDYKHNNRATKGLVSKIKLDFLAGNFNEVLDLEAIASDALFFSTLGSFYAHLMSSTQPEDDFYHSVHSGAVNMLSALYDAQNILDLAAVNSNLNDGQGIVNIAQELIIKHSLKCSRYTIEREKHLNNIINYSDDCSALAAIHKLISLSNFFADNFAAVTIFERLEEYGVYDPVYYQKIYDQPYTTDLLQSVGKYFPVAHSKPFDILSFTYQCTVDCKNKDCENEHLPHLLSVEFFEKDNNKSKVTDCMHPMPTTALIFSQEQFLSPESRLIEYVRLHLRESISFLEAVNKSREKL